jgi:hypothetical protein
VLTAPAGIDFQYGYIPLPPLAIAMMVTYSVIDLPFSAALDTLLLPIDLTYHGAKTPAASPPDK